MAIRISIILDPKIRTIGNSLVEMYSFKKFASELEEIENTKVAILEGTINSIPENEFIFLYASDRLLDFFKKKSEVERKKLQKRTIPLMVNQEFLRDRLNEVHFAGIIGRRDYFSNFQGFYGLKVIADQMELMQTMKYPPYVAICGKMGTDISRAEVIISYLRKYLEVYPDVFEI